jgi:hypothetical protein
MGTSLCRRRGFWYEYEEKEEEELKKQVDSSDAL